jgi:hypothetical protein
MVMIVRLPLARASTFTDAAGNNEKARSLSAWLRQAIRAVVSLPKKPTGVSACNTRAGLTPTHPGKRTTSKLAFLLSLPSPGNSRPGADNERYISRNSNPNHLRTN